MTNFAREVLALLHAIEAGAVTLYPEEGFVRECGDVAYRASNGWRLVVFNDTNSWDYLDRVEAPNGRALDFEEMPPELQSYSPPEKARRRAYGIHEETFLGLLWRMVRG